MSLTSAVANALRWLTEEPPEPQAEFKRVQVDAVPADRAEEIRMTAAAMRKITTADTQSQTAVVISGLEKELPGLSTAAYTRVAWSIAYILSWAANKPVYEAGAALNKMISAYTLAASELLDGSHVAPAEPEALKPEPDIPPAGMYL